MPASAPIPHEYPQKSISRVQDRAPRMSPRPQAVALSRHQRSLPPSSRSCWQRRQSQCPQQQSSQKWQSQPCRPGWQPTRLARLTRQRSSIPPPSGPTLSYQPPSNLRTHHRHLDPRQGSTRLVKNRAIRNGLLRIRGNQSSAPAKCESGIICVHHGHREKLSLPQTTPQSVVASICPSAFHRRGIRQTAKLKSIGRIP